MRKMIMVAAIAVSALSAASANAAVIFSDGFVADSGGQNLLQFNGFSNFTVTGGVDLVNQNNGFGISCAGACVDLAGTPGPGTLTTNAINFVAGQRVNVSFTVSGNQRTASVDPFLASITFAQPTDITGAQATGPFGSVGPVSLTGVTFVPYAEAIAGTRGFVTYSGSFVPTTAGSFTLSFGTDGTLADANIGPILGSVLVSQVPEAHVWAMLIAGFGMVGWSMRRRAALTA